MRRTSRRAIVLAFASVAGAGSLVAPTAVLAQRDRWTPVAGEERRLANWSVRVAAIEYADMSRRNDGMGVRLIFKNISSSAQRPYQKFGGTLVGLTTHYFDTFNISTITDVPPGGEVEVYASRRLTRLQNWAVSSVIVTESAIDDPTNVRSGTTEIARVELPLPPLSPGWRDPELVPVNGPGMRLANWSARVVSINYGSYPDPDWNSSEVLINIALKNTSAGPRRPRGFFEWRVGPTGFNIGPFNVRDDVVVPPGGEIIVPAHAASVRKEEIDGLTFLRLVEHNPGGSGAMTPRSVIATADLPLPPRPAR